MKETVRREGRKMEGGVIEIEREREREEREQKKNKEAAKGEEKKRGIESSLL